MNLNRQHLTQLASDLISASKPKHQRLTPRFVGDLIRDRDGHWLVAEDMTYWQWDKCRWAGMSSRVVAKHYGPVEYVYPDTAIALRSMQKELDKTKKELAELKAANQ